MDKNFIAPQLFTIKIGKKDSMKVCFFSGDITRSGGTERVATIIIQELSKEEVYDISVVSLTENSKELFFKLDDSIKREYFSKKWINPGPGYLLIIVKLIKYLRKNKIDILIDIDGVLDILSLPAKFFTGVKVISWEHFNYHQNLGSFYRKWIRRMAARYADCIVTLTEADRGFYKENLRIQHDIRVIRNPIGYMEEVPKTTFSPNKRKRILSAGNLVLLKGFDYIPRIGDMLMKHYPDLEWDWYIIGDGEERTSIQTEIDKYGLGERIILTGRSETIKDEFVKADIYVMTSRNEGLPMILLEAKTFHLPIISFDVLTGPREMIEHGINGYLVSPPTSDSCNELKEMADKIAVLCSDEELYYRFSKHSMLNMESFQIDYVVECWIDLLESLSDSK